MGLIPFTISNGVLLVVRFSDLLYANSACGNTKSHCLGFSPTKLRNRFPELRFTTSVYPSVCGWCDELNCSWVPILRQKVRQKWLSNFTSRSDVMVLGTPCSLTISCKNNRATCDATNVLLQGIKWAVLENQSTTTIIESLFLWVPGNPRTKSRLMSTHGAVGIGNGWYRLALVLRVLATRQTRHFPTIRAMSRSIRGQ